MNNDIWECVKVGTHGALGIEKESGEHRCVERTMDGYNLCPLIIDLIDAAESEAEMIAKVESLIESAEFGSGSVERGSEREHDHEFFALFDCKKKELSTWGILLKKKQLEKLFAWGWDLAGAGDCCGDLV